MSDHWANNTTDPSYGQLSPEEPTATGTEWNSCVHDRAHQPFGTKTIRNVALPAPVEISAPVSTPTKIAVMKEPASDAQSQVELCKNALRSGKVSWSGGTVWAPVNIDALCNGTKNASETIDCFQKNVEGLGWAKAIEKCQ